MSFSLIPPEINSALMYSGRGVRSVVGGRDGVGRVGRRLGGDRHPVPDRDHQPDHRHVAGSVVDTHGHGRRAVHRLAAEHRGRSGPDRGSGQGCCRAPTRRRTASMVPPPVITANRAELTTLVSNNFLGQNTGAIAQNEAEYLDMWIQDALGMDTYNQASTGASSALPAQTRRADGDQRGGSLSCRPLPPRRPTPATRSPSAIINAIADLFGDAAAAGTTPPPWTLWPSLTTWLPDCWLPPIAAQSRPPRCFPFRRRTTWACWAARPLVCS